MTTQFGSFNRSPLGAFIKSPLGARGSLEIGDWVARRSSAGTSRFLTALSNPPASWDLDTLGATSDRTVQGCYKNRIIMTGFSAPFDNPASHTSNTPGGLAINGMLVVNGTLVADRNGAVYYSTNGINYTLAYARSQFSSLLAISSSPSFVSFSGVGTPVWLSNAYWAIGSYRRFVVGTSGPLQFGVVVFKSSDLLSWTQIGSDGDMLGPSGGSFGATIYADAYSTTYPKIRTSQAGSSQRRWEFNGTAWLTSNTDNSSASVGGLVINLPSGRKIILNGLASSYSDDEFVTLTSITADDVLMIGNNIYRSTSKIEVSSDGAMWSDYGVPYGETPTEFANTTERTYQ
jgi:hypothetical protein